MTARAAFIEALHGCARQLGSDVRLSDGRLSLSGLPLRDFGLLLSELEALGFMVVSSRQNGDAHLLGVMYTQNACPEFFTITLADLPFRIAGSPGLFLAFLGPDGVGKTTTVDRVMAALSPVFEKQQLYHWRPQLLKPRSTSDLAKPDTGWLSINRHGEPPRGAFVSMLRLGGVYADYIFGHVKAIAPALTRGELVVFDRYYHDILVDSLRYRYGGPRFLLSLMKMALPQRKPFFVILDADDGIILSRKQEVTAEELRKQRRRYAALARDLGALHVRTDFGPEQTTREVLLGIGRHLNHRFHKLLQQSSEHVRQSAATEAVIAGNAA